jgi:hypothetical protein
MKRTIVLFAFVAIALVTTSLAITTQRSSPPPPPGVDAANWRPITDDLGVILAIPKDGTVTATLVTRIDSKWRTPQSIAPLVPRGASRRGSHERAFARVHATRPAGFRGR